MFNDDEVLKFCITYGINVNQYFFIYFLIKKDFRKPLDQSLSKQYINKFGLFDKNEITELVDKGYVKDFNIKGDNNPDLYIVDNKIKDKFFIEFEAFDELWLNYPATMKLSNGDVFISRAGNKDYLRGIYLDSKICRSAKKHRRVLGSIPLYIEMLEEGKLSPFKIENYIFGEMWETVLEIYDKGESGESSFREILG